MAVTGDDPDPIIVKIFKKGSELPIKDMRGKTEVLDVLEIIEDDDTGVYVIEMTNTSRYHQDVTFIIKQISQVRKEGGEIEASKLSKVSLEEKRMYSILEGANQSIKHFEVEQQLQQVRIHQFLQSK